MLYAEIISRLQDAGVDFLIIGGVAVNLQGYSRFTGDLDIVLRMNSENLLKTVETLLDAGFTTWLPIDPRNIADEATRRDWLENKNMLALSFKLQKYKIDLVFSTPVSYSELHREEKRIGRFLYPVPSKEDLIRLKEGTGREQDEADIRRLRLLIDIENEAKSKIEG